MLRYIVAIQAATPPVKPSESSDEVVGNSTNPLAAIREQCLDPDTGQVRWGEVIPAILELIDEIDPGLELASLSSVRTSSNYRGLLEEISKDLGRTIVATERESGVGVAMVIPDGEMNILAVDTGILEYLFDPDVAVMLTTLNLLHHELAHIHDGAVKRRNLPDVWMKRRLDGWSYYTNRIAQSAWDEYYAERRSYPTLPRRESLRIPILETEIPKTAQAIRNAVSAHQLHSSMDVLVPAVFQEVGFLFQLAGYALGTLAAAEKPLEEVHAGAASVLRASRFGRHWDALAEHLDLLWRAHGAWPDGEIFAPLEAMVLTTLKELGVVLTIKADGGLWVEILYDLDKDS